MAIKHDRHVVACSYWQPRGATGKKSIHCAGHIHCLVMEMDMYYWMDWMDYVARNFGATSIAPKFFRSPQHQYGKFPSTTPKAPHANAMSSFENRNILLTFLAGWITYFSFLTNCSDDFADTFATFCHFVRLFGLFGHFEIFGVVVPTHLRTASGTISMQPSICIEYALKISAQSSNCAGRALKISTQRQICAGHVVFKSAYFFQSGLEGGGGDFLIPGAAGLRHASNII